MSEQHTLFIVDDDRSNLRALQELLSPQYEILTATSGLDALDIIRHDPQRERIHLIISDQRMPGLTGAEFLRQTTPLLPLAKRILLTGFTDVEAIVGLINDGELYKFILKPYDHNDVLATIRRALEAYDMELQNKRLIKQLTLLNENQERTIEARTQEVQQTLKELEVAMKELQQLNATKDKFFSIIAHDLRNSLYSLLLSSETIVSFIDTFDRQQIAELAENMHQTTTSLHGLLENLLNWATIQKGQLKLYPESCHVGDATRQSLALFEENAALKSISLQVAIPENIWVLVDKNILNTVLRNLLSNAIKFTHQHGHVQITATILDEDVTLTVVDDGVGIAPEHLDDILVLEHQRSQPGTAQETGTGLGLPLCKELLEASESRLVIASRPNEGTQISFRLPLSTRRAPTETSS